MRLCFLSFAVGFLSLIFLTVIIYLPIANIKSNDFVSIFQNKYLIQIIKFTVLQASLSAILSILIALPIARAIFRQCYHLREMIKNFCLFIFVFPSILVVFALVNLHGHNGIFSHLSQFIGLPSASYLYGMNGILLGHIFLNLPLALFIFIIKFEEVSPEIWKHAQLLNFTPRDYFYHLELPILRHAILPIAGIIFTFCALSFAIILNLGGKPRYNTLEVAIYQAVKYDFDLKLAILLGAIQLIFCATALFLPLFFRKQNFTYHITHHVKKNDPVFFKKIRFDGEKLFEKLIDNFAFLLFFILIIMPLMVILIPPSLRLNIPDGFWRALLTSSIITSSATFLAILLSLSLISGAQYYKNHREAILFFGYATFLMPPLLLATGLFLAFQKLPYIFLVIIINALMALPIMLRILAPPAFQIYDNQKKLIEILNLPRVFCLAKIYLPQLKKPLSLAVAFALCLSFGDISGIALFAGHELQTLPFLIFSLMGSYQINDAFILANFMLLIYIIIFWRMFLYARN